MAAESWTDRFNNVVRRLNQDPGYREIVLRRLYALVNPPSEFDLASAIHARIHSGELKVSYRVRSPETGAGLGEYSDIADVPHEIRDPTSDLTFEVQPARDIEVVYRRPDVLSPHP